MVSSYDLPIRENKIRRDRRDRVYLKSECVGTFDCPFSLDNFPIKACKSAYVFCTKKKSHKDEVPRNRKRYNHLPSMSKCTDEVCALKTTQSIPPEF